MEDAFTQFLECYVFVGPRNAPRDKQTSKFIVHYSDKVGDGRSYRNAIANGVWWASIESLFTNRYNIQITGRGGGGLDHNSLDDEYRNIRRWENSEGLNINDGQKREWIISNRRHYRNTNGAYVVFHGKIDNNWVDPDTGTIEIKVDRKEFGLWVNRFSTTYEIRNRWLNDAAEGEWAYGGSDICSQYLNSWFMRSTANRDLRISVEFNSDSAGFIKIDRLELMEIGR